MSDDKVYVYTNKQMHEEIKNIRKLEDDGEYSELSDLAVENLQDENSFRELCNKFLARAEKAEAGLTVHKKAYKDYVKLSNEMEVELTSRAERAEKSASKVHGMSAYFKQVISLWKKYRNPGGRSQMETSEMQIDIGQDLDALIEEWEKYNG